MSDENMANDINKAIASGGYVIVPEKAVDGTGRNAIYVYMTHNGQDGYQSWKISGGLNGGFLSGFFLGLATMAFIVIIIAVGIASGGLLSVFLSLFLIVVTYLLNYIFLHILSSVYDLDKKCQSMGNALGMETAAIIAAGKEAGTLSQKIMSVFASILGVSYLTDFAEIKQCFD